MTNLLHLTTRKDTPPPQPSTRRSLGPDAKKGPSENPNRPDVVIHGRDRPSQPPARDVPVTSTQNAPNVAHAAAVVNPSLWSIASTLCVPANRYLEGGDADLIGSFPDVASHGPRPFSQCAAAIFTGNPAWTSQQRCGYDMPCGTSWPAAHQSPQARDRAGREGASWKATSVRRAYGIA
jgi:hypothetical protein